MVICIDFDGTIAKHEYPDIGEEVPGAFEWMKKFQELGAKLILYTMRCGPMTTNKHGKPVDARDTLQEAVDFCREHGVEFWGANNNPIQHTWSQSPKVYGNLYIDDAAFGCPIITPESGRPYVDWSVVGPAVMEILNA